MKIKNYYVVTNLQIFLCSILIAIIAASFILINIFVKEYLKLPVVIQNVSGECINVINFSNGHAFTCNDVNLILRSFRTKQE